MATKETSAKPEVVKVPKIAADWIAAVDHSEHLVAFRQDLNASGFPSVAKRVDLAIKELDRQRNKHFDSNAKKAEREKARAAKKADRLRKELAELEALTK